MTPGGFEPPIFGMKTQRPRPLDDGATKIIDDIYIYLMNATLYKMLRICTWSWTVLRSGSGDDGATKIIIIFLAIDEIIAQVKNWKQGENEL